MNVGPQRNSQRVATVLCWSLMLGCARVATGQASGVRADQQGSGKFQAVALGGIGTGCIHISPDGAIGGATTNNNWFQPSPELPGCFGAVSIRSGKTFTARVVSLHSSYGLPVTPSLVFDAAFPQAKLRCAESTFPDADVTLRAFSPFIPGDLRSSSMPAAAFVFHIVNRSGAPITASVALSWENTLGIGQTPDGKAFSNRSGNSISPIPDSQGFFGLRFSGADLVNRKSKDPVHDGAAGEMALMAHPYRNSAVVTTASWNSLDTKPPWWDSFARAGVVSGDVATGAQGKNHPAGVVAVQITLKPRDSIDIPFCVAWYTPILRSPAGDDYGHYYQASYPDSLHAARALLGDWETLLALTEEWQRRIMTSSMPDVLNRRLLNSAAPLVTNSILVRDGRFTFLPQAPIISALDSEHPGASYLTERRHACTLLLALFPQLYSEEMVELMAVQAVDGAFPPALEDWAARIGPVTPSQGLDEPAEGNPVDVPALVHITALPRNASTPSLSDSTDFVRQADLLVKSTDDLVFLKHVMPGIRSIMNPFIEDTISKQVSEPAARTVPHKTTDSARSDWLAGLYAGRRMAEIARTHAFEWATSSGPLGNVPGGLIETSVELQFIERCSMAIQRLEADGVKQSTCTPGAPLLSDLLSTGAAINDSGLAQAAVWDLLNRVDGYSVDLQDASLNLTTPIPGTWRSLMAPVFSATFVGRTEFKPTAHGGVLTLRIDRTITLSPVRGYRRRAGATGGPQLSITKLHVAGPPPTNDAGGAVPTLSTIDVHVSLGSNPIGCTVAMEPDSTLLLTFASPLKLLTGDLLQVEVH